MIIKKYIFSFFIVVLTNFIETYPFTVVDGVVCLKNK